MFSFNKVANIYYMVPFIDNCNTIVNTEINYKDHFKYYIIKYDDGYGVVFSSAYKANEEVTYFYSPEQKNNNLIRLYGFYDRNNYNTKLDISFFGETIIFNKAKFNLCEKLGCLPIGLDSTYSINKEFWFTFQIIY